MSQEEKLAEALGWASLALGVPQTVAPGAFDRLIGVEPGPKPRAITVAACGLRELAAAAGILALERPRPAKWLWARVAGDALDLTLLARALRNRSKQPARTAGAMVAVAGISVADLYAATRMGNGTPKTRNPKAAITVRLPVDEVYAFWRNSRELPTSTIERDPESIEDRPNELLSWKAGTVRFREAPGHRGTEIELELSRAVALEFVKDDLRRVKQVLETGEVVRSEGTPEGPDPRRYLNQRPARPLEGSVA